MTTIAQRAEVVLAVALGFFVLAVVSAAGAWTAPTVPSVKPYPRGLGTDPPYRPLVDAWSWSLLNKWYGNPEDGVSAQQAWIWSKDVPPQLITYASTFPTWTPKGVIAYCWSAWRNNANQLKRTVGID